MYRHYIPCTDTLHHVQTPYIMYRQHGYTPEFSTYMYVHPISHGVVTGCTPEFPPYMYVRHISHCLVMGRAPEDLNTYSRVSDVCVNETHASHRKPLHYLSKCHSIDAHCVGCLYVVTLVYGVCTSRSIDVHCVGCAYM